MSETHKQTFHLEITDEDTRQFIKKCFRDGTTPAEVLEGFINDLVAGEQTRGSDERDLAAQYYDRCGYGAQWEEAPTFLQWLFDTDEIDSCTEILNDACKMIEEKDFLEKHEGNPDKDFKAYLDMLQGSIIENAKELNKYYDDYCEAVDKPEAYEEARGALYGYYTTLKSIMQGKDGTL